MARIKQRRMFWDAPAATDVEAYEIYAELAGQFDNATFLTQADLDPADGGLVPHAEVLAPTTEYYLSALAEDTYRLAVVARDDAGNYSDPYQHPDWVSVPLDVSPPDAPSAGGLD